jgi:hypothetical protein
VSKSKSKSKSELGSSNPSIEFTKNNNWTDSKVDKLLEWQQQSRLRALGHGRAQENYGRKNDRIMIPSIICGAVGVLFDAMALAIEKYHIQLVVTAMIITAAGTILDAMLQATKPVEDAAGHENMARGYNKIILQIDAMLAKEFNERQNGSAFLTKIEEELIALKTGGSKIPAKVWNSVKRDFTEGECDFQKFKKESEVSVSPFRHTMQLSSPPQRRATTDTVVDMPVDHADSDTDSSVGSGSNTASEEIPRFELRIDNDPKTKKMEKMFFDFQMNRF